MVDHLALVLLRQSSGLSRRALLSGCHTGEDTCKAMSGILWHVLERKPSLCPQSAVGLSRSSGYRKLEEPYLFYSSFPLPSKERMGKARFFSKGAPWRSPGKSQSFGEELEHQELSLREGSVYPIIF